MTIQKKQLFLALLVFGLALAGAGIAWRFERVRHFWRQHHLAQPPGIQIDKAQYPITGIDVSKHTGRIDWAAVKKQNIHFAYIKASEGVQLRDAQCSENIRAARENGIPVGAYHFFLFHKSGAKQAAFFLSGINGAQLRLPPVIDVEESGNRTLRGNEAQVRREIHRFLRVIKKQTGMNAMIYTNEHTYARLIAHDFPDNPIWISSFNDPPRLSDGRDWLFWQHAHNGTLHGSAYFVDLNTYNGDTSAWKKFLRAKR